MTIKIKTFFSTLQAFLSIFWVYISYETHLTLKRNTILLEELLEKNSLILNEKNVLKDVETVKVNSSNENFVYGISAFIVLSIIGFIIYSYSGSPPPPPGSDDVFQSLVIENLVSLSQENKLISDKIDDLIDVAEPVDIVKNVLLEWKVN